jgi:hypothetical protein
MYSQKFYLKRVRQARQLAALPENAARRRAYLTLADNWQRMAAMAASAAPTGKARTSANPWEPTLLRAMHEAGLS